ncbi:Gfo/Idh/MocA family protein [Paraburkholderia fynbosensis]|uniref:1,5-anhydro-D-fructose reductase n=1 Tax=Paraburkholderia fynbosensis TaxID=1200993 RepID=A0A6J5GZU1_9BURK|nr:Gfo/Idh/MocA family oxidoreductase [Paraburkholderia fynbosensis]CAB3810044.1 1,5-anhydro-D-fructose reductase [Paraburkholderia fynbosensis]
MSVSRVGLIGAGAIGRAHLVGAAQAEGVEIVGIADPNVASRALAEEFSIPWFADHRALVDEMKLDGAIVATPNALHLPISLELIGAGVGVLVEKPIADTVKEALRLARTAADANVPLLVGHHRRHNSIIRTARSLVRDGKLGRLVCVSVLATFLKPDAYFNEAWRRTAAAGPVLINLIHEIDLLRFVCGEIASLHAMTSNAVRGFDVEDTVATVLQLENGAVATITLSDTAASPWSWDTASGENPSFARHPVESHFISGTEGSVALPSLRMWHYAGERGWFHPLADEQVRHAAANPYVEQMRHFGAVIRKEELPLCDGFDGARTLEITASVRRSAESGEVVRFK